MAAVGVSRQEGLAQASDSRCTAPVCCSYGLQVVLFYNSLRRYATSRLAGSVSSLIVAVHAASVLPSINNTLCKGWSVVPEIELEPTCEAP